MAKSDLVFLMIVCMLLTSEPSGVPNYVLFVLEIVFIGDN